MFEKDLSIVIPAKDELEGLRGLLPDLIEKFPLAEIIVVNDGSVDGSDELIAKYDVIEVKHLYSMGNGASIKSGARAATRKWIIFMDGDAQHDVNSVKKIIESLCEGYDMVVGARSWNGHAGTGRGLANSFYNKLASWMVGHKVHDLTSGLRGVIREKFLDFCYLYPNGFSCPTTSTMAFFRAGYSVNYIPVTVHKRLGNSHIKPIKDGLRFLLIIFKIGTLYSPLKIFAPVAFLQFLLGMSYYIFTLIQYGRFTNMSVILFLSAMTVFLIGLVSEQITNLMYKDVNHK